MHREIEHEMQKQIDAKRQEIKNIVPMKRQDILDVTDPKHESELRELLQKYVVNETKVGE